MKTMILAAVLTLSCAFTALAQQAETQSAVSGTNQTSAAAGPADSISIEAGTRLAAELQKSIDVRNARVGDQILLKTVERLKSQGRTIVPKGARLLGHVTEIERRSSTGRVSRLTMVFERLQNGPLNMPITATILSVASNSTNHLGSEGSLEAGSAGASSIMQPASSSGSQNRGLLGGVSGAVPGVVNTTSSVVGDVVGATTAAAGSTTNSTGGSSSALSPLSRVVISDSSSTSADGASTLSLRGENLRLEQGTRFNLVISQSGSATTSKQP